MGLSEIAADLTITESQEPTGVAVVDETATDLESGLEQFAGELPRTPAMAADVIEAYVGGAPVDEAGRQAGVPPMTAAKILHLVGFDGLTPLTPTGNKILDDWLGARLSRSEAIELTSATPAEFELATYMATTEPIPGAREVVESTVDAALASDPLADTRSDATDFYEPP